MIRRINFWDLGIFTMHNFRYIKTMLSFIIEEIKIDVIFNGYFNQGLISILNYDFFILTFQ